MKKTIVSLLTLALVLAMVLVAAPAAEATAAHTAHCACGQAADSAAIAGHTHAAAPEWKPWPGIEDKEGKAYAKVEAGGHYYLTENVARAKKADGTDYTNIIVDKAITLCLNGYSFENKLEVNADLTITDCNTTPGKIISYDGAAKRQGGVLQIKAGTVNLFNAALVYAGDGVNFGGCVALNAENVTFNMYSGMLSGGKNHADAGSGLGGGVFVGAKATAVFNFYGGVITGNTAKKGGGIYAYSSNGVGGKVNLYGGIVSGNTCTLNADVYVGSASTATIKNLDATTTVYYADGATITKTEMDSSLTWPATAAAATAFTLTKANSATVPAPATPTVSTKPASTPSTPSKPNNPATGDSANLVVMGLGLVLGVAGMACLLPKKQNV